MDWDVENTGYSSYGLFWSTERKDRESTLLMNRIRPASQRNPANNVKKLARSGKWLRTGHTVGSAYPL